MIGEDSLERYPEVLLLGKLRPLDSGCLHSEREDLTTMAILHRSKFRFLISKPVVLAEMAYYPRGRNAPEGKVERYSGLVGFFHIAGR